MLEELEKRYDCFRQKLPKILVCSDSGVLPTGLARVVRGIFTDLWNLNKFAIVQHGWFHTSLRTVEVPWPIIPVRRNKTDERFCAPEDKFGQQSFDSVVTSIRPDIVFVVGDYGTFDYILNSSQRSSYQLVAYMPLDAFPPSAKWLEVAKKPDKTVFYTEFAQAWARCAGVPGDFIPHGVDPQAFYPLDEAARESARQRLFGITPDSDIFIIGTVGRVQPRKRLPVFIEAIAHVRAGGYSTCQGCKQISLHQYDPFDKVYTAFAEMQTCPRCNGSYGWEHGKPWPNIKGYLHSDPRENQTVPIDAIADYWNLKKTGAILWNPALKITQAQGISDTNLVETYQCLDLYIHTACGGGCELPNLEAAATGVPIIAADAPAQNEYISKLKGSVLVRGDAEWDHTSVGYRVFTRVQDIAAALIHFLELPTEEKLRLGELNRESAFRYDWNQIVYSQWLPLFQQLLDPTTRIDGWRVLQEV